MIHPLFFFIFICLSNLALGYIPNSQFIFERITSLHGKGAYSIEDEVTFHDGLENSTVKENWIIVDGGEMRLTAHADALKLTKIYKRGREYWLDLAGSERSDEIPVDFFMSPLLTRSESEEKKIFVKWGIIPAETLKEKKPPTEVKDIKIETEDYVRLGRISGTITYFYGTPSPKEGPLPPGLWVEQDTFLIRKMRSPSGAEFLGDDFGIYSKSLWFPKTQTFLFDNRVVNLHVTKVSSIDLSHEQKKQLDTGWFRGRSDAAALFPKTTMGTIIQDFYKRFR